MTDWDILFNDCEITTAEKYRLIENGPIGQIARYYFKKLNHPNRILSDYIQELKTGKTPPTHQSQYFSNSDIDWYKPDEIGKSMFLYESRNKLAKLAVEEKKATLFSKNTLLINCIGDIGRVSLLKAPGASNQQITGILFNDDILPEYAYYYILANRDYFLTERLETTLPIINQTKLRNVPFFFTPKPEQTKLVEFITHFIDYLHSGELPDFKEGTFNPELGRFAKKMVICDRLRQQVIELREQSELLMQSVLREAFEHSHS